MRLEFRVTTVTREKENFIPLDKNLLTHNLYVPLQDMHRSDKREWRQDGKMVTRGSGEREETRGREEERRREETGW